MDVGILSVQRSELKYQLGYVEVTRLQKDLQKLLIPDVYSKDGSYVVRSLYFDSIDNRDYTEKYDGEQVRRKIRLRIYDAECDFAKFEIKKKSGEFQQKISLKISREDALCVMKNDYSVLFHYNSPVAMELFSLLTLKCYRPVALIEYSRRAFVYPEFNTRVTIDCNVRCSELDLRLYEKNIAWVPVIDNCAILEVKYNGMLFRPISKILRKYNLSQLSVSKYGYGRPILSRYII